MPVPLIIWAAAAAGAAAGTAVTNVAGAFARILHGVHMLETGVQCDIFQGRWVYDDHYRPLYNPQTCPFVNKQLECQNNGRPDKDYVKYRWIPHSCRLPRFSANNFLKRIRGKRIMFVGDSIGESQWASLGCMILSGDPDARATGYDKGYTLKLPKYNASVVFSRNDFLVDIVAGDKKERILKLDSVENGGEVWKNADVLVFNTWNQGLQTGKNRSWDVIEEGNTRHKDMDPLVAYGKALKTWAKWVKSSVDTNKTKIFFQGVSPDHFNKRDRANPKANDCRRQTRPVPGPIAPGGPHPGEAVLEKVLKTIPKKVHLVNVTGLSLLRKDGHPSIYGTKNVDCSNWCLPGVPDAWNELLYASLIGY